MPDIEKAYHILVAAASDAIDLLEYGDVWDTRKLLQSALLRAEEETIRERGPGHAGLFPDCCRPLPLRPALGLKKGKSRKRGF